MIQTRNAVIFLTLLLANSLAEEQPVPIFKALGGELEMGFCFGDDVAVYRMTSEGRELLAQASSSRTSDAFKGRINISDEIAGLLGLKITNLQFSDSGMYISECWSDGAVDHFQKHYLYVCNEEMASKEITLTPRTGADLVCNLESRKKATVKWYKDEHNASLFMDTSISLEPLQEEFKKLVQVKDEGSYLHVSDELIQDRPRFVCLVIEAGQCKSFQVIELPNKPVMNNVYRSVGESLVLKCSVNHLRESHWKTPSGQINSSTPVYFKGTVVNQIFVSGRKNSEDYSLAILSLSDQHSGSYKCFSTFLIEEYVLNVCPLLELTTISFSEKSKKVVLQCDFMSLPAISGKIEYASVEWYRTTSKNDVLIMDSGDPSLSPPDDLKGRVNFSQVDSSLILTDPKKEDSGTYWCVVILDNDFPEVDDVDAEYESDDAVNKDEYDVEEEEEEHNSWTEEEDYMDICLFRQVTNLEFKSGNTRMVDTNTTSQLVPATQPESETNITIYAVCVGIGGLFLCALVGIVVVLKMRAKKSYASVQRDVEL